MNTKQYAKLKVKDIHCTICEHIFIGEVDITQSCPSCESSIEWYRGIPIFYDDIKQDYSMRDYNE